MANEPEALTPEWLAAAFWDMDCGQQAEFFNWLGQRRRSLMRAQFEYILKYDQLTEKGRSLLKMIGDLTISPIEE